MNCALSRWCVSLCAGGDDDAKHDHEWHYRGRRDRGIGGATRLNRAALSYQRARADGEEEEEDDDNARYDGNSNEPGSDAVDVAPAERSRAGTHHSPVASENAARRRRLRGHWTHADGGAQTPPPAQVVSVLAAAAAVPHAHYLYHVPDDFSNELAL